MRWVLLDETNGAPCANGETLTPAKLATIAEALSIQLNRDYASECGAPGGGFSVRAGSGPADIQVGESVFTFVPALPAAPGLVAYHDVGGNGVPFEMEAITACGSLTGQGNSASVAASHECLEAAGDPGCNQMLDDKQGTLHAKERCDACEANSYPVTTSSGEKVFVSDFLLDAWTIPGAPAPYTYTDKAGLPAVSQPPGPMQTAPANGANYQVECPSTTSQEGQVMGMTATNMASSHMTVRRGMVRTGTPMRAHRIGHWSTRAYRRGVR